MSPAPDQESAGHGARLRGALAALLLGLPGAAWAQFDAPSVTPRDLPPVQGTGQPGAARVSPFAGFGSAGPRQDPNAPVTFTADEVEYDRERGLVTARGKVEAWQGERLLRADEFTYDAVRRCAQGVAEWVISEGTAARGVVSIPLRQGKSASRTIPDIVSGRGRSLRPS